MAGTERRKQIGAMEDVINNDVINNGEKQKNGFSPKPYGKKLFDENNRLTFDIVDYLSAADVAAAVSVMTEIERKFFAENVRLKTHTGTDLSAALLDFVNFDCWQIKAKALITVGRIGGADQADKIIELLKEEKQPCWQLQYLDCWWQLPVDSKKRAVVLADLTEWADQPVTVRGLVWLLKELGTPEAAEIFVKFALNKKTMMVKEEFMTDAWYEIADKISPAAVKDLTVKYPAFKVWLNFRYPEEKSSHYSLYPSPDYLWQCAAEQGVDRKEFKKLYFKPRKKV